MDKTRDNIRERASEYARNVCYETGNAFGAVDSFSSYDLEDAYNAGAKEQRRLDIDVAWLTIVNAGKVFCSYDEFVETMLKHLQY